MYMILANYVLYKMEAIGDCDLDATNMCGQFIKHGITFSSESLEGKKNFLNRYLVQRAIQ